MSSKKGSIYFLTNVQDEKIYIGQTQRNVKMRLIEHIHDSKRKKTKFHTIVKNEGIELFGVQYIDNCPIEALDIIESTLISLMSTQDDKIGYNVSNGGNNQTVSEEMRQSSSRSRGGKICNIQELKKDGILSGYMVQRVEQGIEYNGRFDNKKFTLEENLQRAQEYLIKIKNKDSEIMNKRKYNKTNDLPPNISEIKSKNVVTGYIFRINGKHKHSKTFSDKTQSLESKLNMAIKYKKEYLEDLDI